MSTVPLDGSTSIRAVTRPGSPSVKGRAAVALRCDSGPACVRPRRHPIYGRRPLRKQRPALALHLPISPWTSNAIATLCDGGLAVLLAVDIAVALANYRGFVRVGVRPSASPKPVRGKPDRTSLAGAVMSRGFDAVAGRS